MRWVGIVAAAAWLAGCASGTGGAGASEKARGATRPATSPAAEPPPQHPAPPPGPSAPVPAHAGANPTWWIDSPRREAGRVAIAARADADSLIDARRAAVQAGTDALRGELKSEPADVQTEKADLAHLDDGRWRVFVLMSGRE